MIETDWLLLVIGGLCSGILTGFLGIGGGTVLVPLQVALGYTPLQAVATSCLAIVITVISGSQQNSTINSSSLKRIMGIGLPALISALFAVELANRIPSYILLFSFGILLFFNIYLVELRKRLTSGELQNQKQKFNPTMAKILIGVTAGMLTGLFGMGGGVIMVPLQILLLGEPLKEAIQTSLGVIAITAISAAIAHAVSGNILFVQGIILGTGGILGAKICTRLLPRLPDELVRLSFQIVLQLFSVYMFWQAWQAWQTLT